MEIYRDDVELLLKVKREAIFIRWKILVLLVVYITSLFAPSLFHLPEYIRGYYEGIGLGLFFCCLILAGYSHRCMLPLIDLAQRAINSNPKGVELQAERVHTKKKHWHFAGR